MLAASSSVSDESAIRAAVDICGASLALDAYGPQAVRDESIPSFERLLLGAVALLPDLGVVAVTGDERTRFLHSITTNDAEHQPLAEARWHGLCTPKGRLLATMLAWRDQASFQLLLPRPQAEAVRKRLSMYVLRAKVRVQDRSAENAILGLCGARAADALAALGLPAPVESAVACEGIDGDAAVAATVIGLPAVRNGAQGEAHGDPGAPPDRSGERLARWLLVVPAASLAAIWPRLAALLHPIGSASWRWTDVRSGIARIVPATVEQFVPQMINFDSVGGVSFNKGCYPGQEIVARAHYLGKVKRRVFLGHLAGPEPAPGTEVFGPDDEPVGVVVMAAPAPGGGTDLLLEAQAAALAQPSPLRVEGRALRVESLPYPLAGDA